MAEMARPNSMASFQARGRKERLALSVLGPMERARSKRAWACQTEMACPTAMAAHPKPGPMATKAWLREQALRHPDTRQ